MAVITSTASDISLSSGYTCTQVVYEWDTGGAGGDFTTTQSLSASYPSEGTGTITFNYTLPTDETVNMVVLQMTPTSPYGGTLKVDDTTAYTNAGVYTVYIQPSKIGTNSTTFTLKFRTNNPTHTHTSNYDSKTTEMGSSDSSGTEYIHTYKKSHTYTLTLSNISLKIYAGDDYASTRSAAGIFVGVNGVAKKVNDIYVGINGVAKKVSDAWVGVGGLARKIWPSVELKDVPVGSKLQLDEDGNGHIFNYIVVAQNHYLNDTNTEGHTVLMREQLLDTTSKFGNNSWGLAYEGEELDIYINETWKASLSGNIILKLMNITIPTSEWSDPYTSSIERQIWIPSRGELYEAYTTTHEGPCFEYFINKTDDSYRIAYISDGTAQPWWTRSCVEGSSPYARSVMVSGAITNNPQGNAFYCRPVFCLSNSLPVALISDGIYDLVI